MDNIFENLNKKTENIISRMNNLKYNLKNKNVDIVEELIFINKHLDNINFNIDNIESTNIDNIDNLTLKIKNNAVQTNIDDKIIKHFLPFMILYRMMLDPDNLSLQ